MFEKSLSDLIHGLRTNRRSEARYVASCIDECRVELKSTDHDIKTQATLKITYLQMLGYDMGWASFHVVEVMSQPRFKEKRLGYLAAALSFTQDTTVLMLATNLMQKDMRSKNPTDICVALGTLADIATPDLARDLGPQVQQLIGHPNPRVRKRASIAIFKCCLRHPPLLEGTLPLLFDRLEDTDQAVVGVVVNVVCELAKTHTHMCLPLAPPLFRLLVTSSNNWMLIKIVKLFGVLTHQEPRLVRKLALPLRQLLETTPAMSLMHECVQTVLVSGLLDAPIVPSAVPADDEQEAKGRRELAEVCIGKLRTLLENEDPNLKYVAMLTMSQMIAKYPRLVAMHHDIIVACLSDPDLSIRTRALDLLLAMGVGQDWSGIQEQLLAQLIPYMATGEETAEAAPVPRPEVHLDPHYRTRLLARILQVGDVLHGGCTEWTLSQLARVDLAAEGPKALLGRRIASALVSRVIQKPTGGEDMTQSIRWVREMAEGALAWEADVQEDDWILSDPEILGSAFFLLGEYGGVDTGEGEDGFHNDGDSTDEDDHPPEPRLFTPAGDGLSLQRLHLIRRLPDRVQRTLLRAMAKAWIVAVKDEVESTDLDDTHISPDSFETGLLARIDAFLLQLSVWRDTPHGPVRDAARALTFYADVVRRKAQSLHASLCSKAGQRDGANDDEKDEEIARKRGSLREAIASVYALLLQPDMHHVAPYAQSMVERPEWLVAWYDHWKYSAAALVDTEDQDRTGDSEGALTGTGQGLPDAFPAISSLQSLDYDDGNFWELVEKPKLTQAEADAISTQEKEKKRRERHAQRRLDPFYIASPEEEEEEAREARASSFPYSGSSSEPGRARGMTSPTGPLPPLPRQTIERGDNVAKVASNGSHIDIDAIPVVHLSLDPRPDDAPRRLLSKASGRTSRSRGSTLPPSASPLAPSLSPGLVPDYAKDKARQVEEERAKLRQNALWIFDSQAPSPPEAEGAKVKKHHKHKKEKRAKTPRSEDAWESAPTPPPVPTAVAEEVLVVPRHPRHSKGKRDGKGKGERKSKAKVNAPDTHVPGFESGGSSPLVPTPTPSVHLMDMHTPALEGGEEDWRSPAPAPIADTPLPQESIQPFATDIKGKADVSMEDATPEMITASGDSLPEAGPPASVTTEAALRDSTPDTLTKSTRVKPRMLTLAKDDYLTLMYDLHLQHEEAAYGGMSSSFSASGSSVQIIAQIKMKLSSFTDQSVASLDSSATSSAPTGSIDGIELTFTPSDDLAPQGLNLRGSLEYEGVRVEESRPFTTSIALFLRGPLKPEMYLGGEVNYAKGHADGTRSFHQLDWSMNIPISTWMEWPLKEGAEDLLEAFRRSMSETEDHSTHISSPFGDDEAMLGGFGGGFADVPSSISGGWHCASGEVPLDEARLRTPFPRLSDILATRVTRTVVVERKGMVASLFGRGFLGDAVAITLERDEAASLHVEVRSKNAILADGIYQEIRTSLGPVRS